MTDHIWLNHLIGNIRGMGINDYLDIVVVAFLIYYLVKLIKEIKDSGVAVLSMHAPLEIISKADLYEAVKAYKAFMINA